MIYAYTGKMFTLGIRENVLYAKILDAQKFMHKALEARQIFCSTDIDPYHSGFIGVENSIITTKRGSLASKQCSANPIWGVKFLRWFETIGLKCGDKVFLSVSSSFPALVYSCIAACEARELCGVLCVSLGSSSWGANRPELNMSVILELLTQGGFMNMRPELYTLGGKNENAENMSHEGREYLIRTMQGKPLEMRNSLQEITALKAKYISGSKLVINIGGNASFPGYCEPYVPVPSGVIMPDEKIDCGNGLAAIALRAGIPVINIREVKSLAEKFGISSKRLRGYSLL